MVPVFQLWGSTFVVAAGSGAQNAPEAAGLADGSVAFAWREPTTTVKMQRWDGFSSTLGPVVTVTTNAGVVGGGSSDEPISIAGLTDGSIGVAWEARPSGLDHVYVKKYSAASVEQWFLDASTSVGGASYLPNLVAQNSGGMVLTYTDSNAPLDLGRFGYSVVSRGIGGNSVIGPRVTMSDSWGGDYDGVSARMPNGGFVFLWDDDLGPSQAQNGNDGVYSTFGRIDAPSGSPGVEGHTDPELVANAAGAPVAVFSFRNTTTFTYEVRTGTGSGATTRINTTNSPISNMDPNIVALKDGSFLVVWNDGGSATGGADMDILGRFVDPAGAPIGAEFVVTQAAGVTNNAIASLDATRLLDGRVLVTWEAAGPQSNGVDVYAQIVDPRGGAESWTGTATAEYYAATAFGDTLNGAGGDDTMIGGAGVDTIRGGTENDTIIGGAGGDFLYGDAGLDTIYGGDGADFIQDNDGASSVLAGEAGNDTIYGGAGNDYVVGGDGDDVMVGLGGQDSLYGGAGNDYIVAGNGVGSVVDGGAGANTLWGASGADYMVGGEGADLLVGGAGSDYQFGNAGADTHYGGQGTDFLYTNAGNDFVWTDDVGQPQSTDYVYAGGGTGTDTIADFIPGAGATHDVLVVSPASGVASFAQAQANMSQVGVYTVLALGADRVYLYNVQPFQLTAENFLFL